MHSLSFDLLRRKHVFYFHLYFEKSDAIGVDKRDIRRIGGDKFSRNNCTFRKCMDFFRTILFSLNTYSSLTIPSNI